MLFVVFDTIRKKCSNLEICLEVYGRTSQYFLTLSLYGTVAEVCLTPSTTVPGYPHFVCRVHKTELTQVKGR